MDWESPLASAVRGPFTVHLHSRLRSRVQVSSPAPAARAFARSRTRARTCTRASNAHAHARPISGRTYMHLHSRLHEQTPPAAGPHTSKELKSGPASLASAARGPFAVQLHSHLRGYLRSPRGQEQQQQQQEQQEQEEQEEQKEQAGAHFDQCAPPSEGSLSPGY